MFRANTITEQLNRAIRQGASGRLTDKEFVMNEIATFKASPRRKAMLDGVNYFKGIHDILRRERQIIGEGGRLETVDNLPNNRIIDNQYRKMVNQKVNYLLGHPVAAQTDNTDYAEKISDLIDKRFMRKLGLVGRDSLNCGLGWLYVGSDGDKLILQRIPPYELIPLWADADHSELDGAIRFYEITDYEGKKPVEKMHVEVYDHAGITRFVQEDNKLILVSQEPYFTISRGDGEFAYNWSQIPLIPFKSNSLEIPLINNIKCLQDGLNLIISNFQNNMEEDVRNTLLVLVNYDGENLGSFRKNLSAYGAVKVRSIDGAQGDVRTLQIEVNAENYKTIMSIFRRAIIENAMGYDAKDDRLSGNPNQMNILSMYSDIDLDANEMETEYQAAFEQLFEFFNAHLYNVGVGDFTAEKVDVIFNRDMLISEADVIQNIRHSVGILSEETIIANHPWVDDVKAELDRIKSGRNETQGTYDEAFAQEPTSEEDDA